MENLAHFVTKFSTFLDWTYVSGTFLNFFGTFQHISEQNLTHFV